MDKFIYIDTSATFSLVALFDESSILSCKSTTLPNQHAQSLNSHIEILLSETNTIWGEIKAVAVMNGPGSYTGLRIGLASAKGFCYAHDIALILMNQFQLLHFYLPEKKNIALILQARENEYFVQAYNDQGNELENAGIKNLEEVLHFKQSNGLKLISTDEKLSQIFGDILIETVDHLSIQKMVVSLFRSKNFANLMHSEPYYLKNVHINKINKL